jgi:glycerophosphoryl diester phosphodiesterase
MALLGAAGAVAALARRATARPRPGHPYLAGGSLLIAHRGGSLLAPENTVLAFSRALEWWAADILELDVQATRDGVAVVIHDETVDRTTDGTGPVAGHTLQQLRRLDAGHRFRDEQGDHPFRGRGLSVPTLEEVLETFPQARVNVELKTGAAQESVWSTVRRMGAERRVLIAAGDRAHRSRFAGYRGAVSASSQELMQFYLCHRARAVALCGVQVDAFQMPEYHLGRRVVTPRLIREAHRRNVPVHVWTVDGADDMRRLLRWGVDGIVTDRPDVLARVLHEERGRPLPPGPPPPGPTGR